MPDEKRAVVELVDAGVPADQGLSSLGLLMQLAGNLFAAGAGMFAFFTLFTMRGSGETLFMLLFLAACVTRSLFLRNAGTQLLYANGDANRLAGIRRYIGIALVQTLFVGALLGAKFHVPGKAVLGVVAGLAVWPVMLAVLMSLPRFRRFKSDVPLTEDKGFEGASILMTVLGVCGLVAGVCALLILFDLPSELVTKGPGVLVALALLMLVARSALHLQAGMSGLRETSLDRAVDLANRYSNFGVISAFCAGGALLMFVISNAMSVIGLAVICGICWLLMAWPLIIRRFFSERQFADLLAGDDAPIHRRAPDAGVTGLGWLLLAHAAFSATFVLPQLIADDPGSSTLRNILFAGGALATRSVWFAVGLLILQGWAGFELIRMSRQSRIVASVFAVVCVATTLYVQWPIIEELRNLKGFMKPAEVALYGLVVFGLILPVATLLLVNRRIAPTARARFRAK